VKKTNKKWPIIITYLHLEQKKYLLLAIGICKLSLCLHSYQFLNPNSRQVLLIKTGKPIKLAVITFVLTVQNMFCKCYKV
ncbi:hypothetical protein BpHYR1_029864, partial [Brachionus plicatilis]